jgi:hypothetical protein
VANHPKLLAWPESASAKPHICSSRRIISLPRHCKI